MIALLEARRAGLLSRSQWLPNLLAGLVVGVVALPLAMAFAIASGAKPEQGLYTAIIAGLFVSAFGGSRVQIAGPTGAFIVILSGITANHGIEGLQIATMMAGLMLVALGFARMGVVIKFIPDPVIVGFTAGIGVIIWVGQWKDFFGLPRISGEHFHQKLWALLQALPQFSPQTTALAVLSLGIVLGTPHLRWLRRVPGPLLALVVATTLQAVFGFDGIANSQYSCDAVAMDTGEVWVVRYDALLAACTRRQAAAHLLQLGPRGHLLREQGCLDAVEQPLQPADELGLGDPQLGFGRDALLGERRGEDLADVGVLVTADPAAGDDGPRTGGARRRAPRSREGHPDALRRLRLRAALRADR